MTKIENEKLAQKSKSHADTIIAFRGGHDGNELSKTRLGDHQERDCVSGVEEGTEQEMEALIHSDEAFEYAYPSRGALVDWHALLTLITDDLDLCVKKLKRKRRDIAELLEDHFPVDKRFEGPDKNGLQGLVRELESLEYSIKTILCRFKLFKPKLFAGVARDALHDLKNEYPISDLLD